MQTSQSGAHTSSIAAVVLTHRRPRLATEVVQGLIDHERFPPSHVILVVNGEGGLEDAALQESIDVVYLPTNLGPAGGFRSGMQRARAHVPDARWILLCEDDIGLFDLQRDRVRPLVAAVEAWEQDRGRRVGAVFAFGRDLNRRTGISVPHRPSGTARFEPVDVAAWGASLVSARVVDAGILPTDEWFFGFEDFDMWLRVADAGFALLLDTAADAHARSSTRDDAFAGQRPRDVDEPWRAYYTSRNFFELARRHGHVGWTAWHLVKSVRRLQLAHSKAGRRAIAHGLWDGLRRRMGVNPRYVREVGEL